ncbi:MAG: DUF748 domain-containing protein, partial [Candidatus Omnitrophica bacterium]|nr:DUF748 domain-containing protein [Candidatus Omnitrophota bacterium]
MKKKNKIIIAIVILIITVFVALSAAVSMFGKTFLERKLSRALGIKSSIDSISLSVPLTINIRGLEIGELLQAQKISFSPGRLTITDPVVNLELSGEGKLNLPAFSRQGGAPQNAKKNKEGPKSKKAPFLLTALNIKNGKFIFTDKKIMPQGYKTIIEGINIDIAKNILLPTSLKMNFSIEAEVADDRRNNLGAIDSSGWIDFGPKDMDGVLEIKELELTYFSPYYGNFLSNRKLLSAKLSTLSGLKAGDNNLEIDTHLKLHDLVYAQEKTAEKISPASTFDLAQKTRDLFP